MSVGVVGLSVLLAVCYVLAHVAASVTGVVLLWIWRERRDREARLFYGLILATVGLVLVLAGAGGAVLIPIVSGGASP